MGQTPDAVSRAGDTMTGPLILSGPPTQENQAATKGYVDGHSLSYENMKQELIASIQGFDASWKSSAITTTASRNKLPLGMLAELQFNSFYNSNGLGSIYFKQATTTPSGYSGCILIQYNYLNNYSGTVYSCLPFVQAQLLPMNDQLIFLSASAPLGSSSLTPQYVAIILDNVRSLWCACSSVNIGSVTLNLYFYY